MTRTVYSVAFKDGKFLMVYNRKRKGWEMPGGHVEEGETTEEAARREFAEESGYAIQILAVKDIGCCDVCACRLLERITDRYEMDSDLFADIPDELSFGREEYDGVISWASQFITE